jgi:hypothetical protein
VCRLDKRLFRSPQGRRGRPWTKRAALTRTPRREDHHRERDLAEPMLQFIAEVRQRSRPEALRPQAVRE